jgi:hypothetical protein
VAPEYFVVVVCEYVVSSCNDSDTTWTYIQ